MSLPESTLASVERGLFWLPEWALSLIEFGILIGLALVLHRHLFRLLGHVAAKRDLFWRSLVSRTRGPVRLAFVAIAVAIATSIAPLTYNQANLVQHMLLIVLIGLIAWVLRTALHIWMTVYLRRFKLDAEDNVLARKHVTQSHILQRVASFFIYTTAISAALMTFENVRQYGISILASAGAAGLVVGLALQPVLKNLLAGIQIAVTQPIRIGDSLVVEDEMGNVEDINSTYVVLRLWDLRRMILPLSYFIEQPFQNWTRESTQLLGTIMLYLDYVVPVAALRKKAEEIVHASPLWDQQVFGLQVTDFKESTMEVRVLVSATNSGRLFDLRCEVREKIIAFLQESYPEALPRLRAQLGPSETAVPGNGEFRPQRDGTEGRQMQ